MAHPHGHLHDHEHSRDSSRGRLAFAFALTCAMLIVEAAGGWWSGSLALLADAAHMLVDAGALALAWAAAVFALKPADARRSFGYARMEVLAGFVNALVQLLLVAGIVYEAIRRMLALDTIHIHSGVMLVVAVAGLLVNAAVLRSLHGHDDLNTAGARLHVFGDLLGSVATVFAALLVRYLGWEWADPVLSLLVSLLILRGAFALLRRSAHILLEGVPEGLAPDEMRAALAAADPSIVEVHHLHVWQIASGSRMATLHARVCEGGDAQQTLRAIQRVLRERYAISHVTVQVESSDCLDPEPGCAGHEHHGPQEPMH
ncbi:MAG: Cobalt/zinc/cadmium resistance protein CzcD [Rhodanobacteraceae bacterium]|jgi:cobalt-zinc-cadmium efflux system protein|nr:MAG: Cobalt/zinc/cadmium resistance protein CzcD [Rhodanobacteraceae bacterium]